MLIGFMICKTFLALVCFENVQGSDVPSVTVELAIVCDMDFGQNFDYDEERITDYWISQVRDLDMIFATLQKTSVKFTLTAVKSPLEQPFIENNRPNLANLTVNLHQIQTEFWAWIKWENIAINSDLVILVTGVDFGHLTMMHVHPGTICQKGIKDQSALVLSSLPEKWHTQPMLAAGVANMIGDERDLNDCLGDGFVADIIPDILRRYYFSSCSDFSILRFIERKKPHCLLTQNNPVDLANNIRRPKRPFDLNEQCQLKLGDSSAEATISGANCFVTFCVKNTPQNSSILDELYPLYDTPCGNDNSFCFRSRCLRRGILIRNVYTEMCVLSTDLFADNDVAVVKECPEVPNKYHEIMIEEKENLGLVLSMVYTNPRREDKCLTVDPYEKKLKFEKCPATNSRNFGWDFVNANSGSGEFYLCHRRSKTCGVLDDGRQYIIFVNATVVLNNPTGLWRFHLNDTASVDSSRFVKNRAGNLKYCQYYYDEQAKRKCCDQTGLFKKCPSEVVTTTTEIVELDPRKLRTQTPSNSTEHQRSDSKDEKSDSSWIAYLTLGLVAMIIIAIGAAVFAFFLRKSRRIARSGENLELHKFYNGESQRINANEGVTDQVDLLPFDKRWEFPESLLKLGKVLGAGAFGLVVEAKAIGILENEAETKVAVKMVNTSANVTHLKALMTELKVMSHLGGHLNIVNLLGACTKNIAKSRQLYVIIEFCKYGCLRDYLRNHRINFVDELNSSKYVNNPKPNQKNLKDVAQVLKITRAETDTVKTSIQNLSSQNESSLQSSMRQGNASENDYHETPVEMKAGTSTDRKSVTINVMDLTCWSFQIARGMEYLTSKRILHGDLAARNCLLAENNVIKICDFGYSKTLNKDYDYNYRKNCEGVLLPFKWMAVESMTCGMFSSETDCWSYGVVLWEIFSLGEIPYPGFNVDNNFIDYVANGNRMSKPRHAPQEIYDLMLQCWSHNPEARPKFGTIVDTIGEMLEKDIYEHLVQMNSDYQSISKFATKSNLLFTLGQSQGNIGIEAGYQNLIAGPPVTSIRS